MRQGVSKKGETLSATLERLLRDLSNLETCTLEILKVVQTVLASEASWNHVDPSKSKIKQLPQGNGAARTRKTAQESKQTDVKLPEKALRNVQKIIKVGLTTLEKVPQTPSRPGPVSRRCDIPPSAAIHPQLRPPEPHEHARILALICTNAFDHWTGLAGQDDVRITTIAKARHNFILRLLELQLASLKLPENE